MTRVRESVVVHRPVMVELVPSGAPMELHKGTRAEVTQALGSSFSLLVEGRLVRLRGSDADAIGRDLPCAPTLPDDASLEEIRSLVWRTLETCYDPEIPVNIVDLGLVYACEILAVDQGRVSVSIEMTLTAPGCGMGEGIAREVREKIEALPHVVSVRVDLVFDPPWDRTRMSDDAALALGL